jgi:hypothetical protein
MNSKRGRPLLPATQASRKNARMWAENRPAYVVDRSPSDLFKNLVNGDAFKSVRKELGLAHKSIPDALVIDVLKSMEGETDEFAKKTNDRLAQKKSEIHISTKKGGHQLPSKNLREVIDAHVEGGIALKAFFLSELSYKALRQVLDDMRLPTPDDRTLRRWRKSYIGH